MRHWVFGVCLPLFLAACAERDSFELRPDAAAIGTPHTIFVATNREPAAQSFQYGKDRNPEVVYQSATVVVPKNHVDGQLSIRHRNPDPQRHFTISQLDRFNGKAEFERALSQASSGLSAFTRGALFFVHGFNNSFAEGLYRHAQMQHDVDAFAIHVNFSWPSAASPLGYGHDHDSALFSRDALVKALKATRSGTDAKPFILAHSMGALLTMEAIRQIEIGDPGWTAKNIAGVALIAPDIDIDVFKSQLTRIEHLPQPFMLFVSDRDVALQVSGLINGRPSRLGNDNDLADLADVPVLVFDISAFGSSKLADHFSIASSPELLEFFRKDGIQKLLLAEAGSSFALKLAKKLVGVTRETKGRAIFWRLEPIKG